MRYARAFLETLITKAGLTKDPETAAAVKAWLEWAFKESETFQGVELPTPVELSQILDDPQVPRREAHNFGSASLAVVERARQDIEIDRQVVKAVLTDAPLAFMDLLGSEDFDPVTQRELMGANLLGLYLGAYVIYSPDLRALTEGENRGTAVLLTDKSPWCRRGAAIVHFDLIED